MEQAQLFWSVDSLGPTLSNAEFKRSPQGTVCSVHAGGGWFQGKEGSKQSQATHVRSTCDPSSSPSRAMDGASPGEVGRQAELTGWAPFLFLIGTLMRAEGADPCQGAGSCPFISQLQAAGNRGRRAAGRPGAPPVMDGVTEARWQLKCVVADRPVRGNKEPSQDDSAAPAEPGPPQRQRQVSKDTPGGGAGPSSSLQGPWQTPCRLGPGQAWGQCQPC